jgi:hypothetical protein
MKLKINDLNIMMLSDGWSFILCRFCKYTYNLNYKDCYTLKCVYKNGLLE